MEIGKIFVWTDQCCDYVPILSCVTNLVDLIQKISIDLFVDQSTVDQSRYYTHIQEKTYKRCFSLIFLFFLGNLIFAIYDFMHRNEDFAPPAVDNMTCRNPPITSEEMEEANKQAVICNSKNVCEFKPSPEDGNKNLNNYNINEDRVFQPYLFKIKLDLNQLIRVPSSFKKNHKFMLEAVKINDKSILYASNDLKNSKKFMLAAAEINYLTLFHASYRLLNDDDFMLKAVKIDYKTFSSASYDLKKCKAFVFNALDIDYRVLSYITQDLSKDQNYMLDVASMDYRALEYASDEFKNSEELMLKVIKKDYRAIAFVPYWMIHRSSFLFKAVEKDYRILEHPDIKKHRANWLFMEEAIKINYRSFKYISQSLKSNSYFIERALEINDRISSLNYLGLQVK